MYRRILILGFGLSIFAPKLAFTHSFGKLYSLPIPFWMYLYGASITMVLSFLIIGYFFSTNSSTQSGQKVLYLPRLNFLLNLKVQNFFKFLSFFLFSLTILTGLFGNNSSYLNFNMTFFWIYFVLGFTYLTFLFGNIYTILNPWKILTDWLVSKNEPAIFSYPKWLGYYPALLFYFIFIWLELFGGVTPFKLSLYLVIYTIINDIGVVCFSSNIWYKYCEFFSVFFRLVSKMSPLKFESGKFYLRMPFTGILKEKIEEFSLLPFIIFMLASTAFDGFRETIFWARDGWIYVDQVLRPVFAGSSYKVYESLGLILGHLVFILIYFIFIYLSKVISKSDISTKNLMITFALSLLPIAFVYNIAHYYTLIFTEGPNIVRLLSDPFGFGWNLFGTSDFYKSFIIGANFIWHSEVVLILIGHIAAVYLAHLISLEIFISRKRAILSQFPMLILMILYTVIGLWILSAPLVA